jgi:ATP-dependent DNA ligase
VGGRGVRLFAWHGYNFADRFPVSNLPARSCLIDGEAIVVDESGLSVFDLLRYRRYDQAALLSAFDLLELDSRDLRHTGIEERKGILAKLVSPQASGHRSTSTTPATARSSTSTPARSAVRALYRNGSAHRTARAESNAGLKVKEPAAPTVRRRA